jgi:hypothetical protein
MKETVVEWFANRISHGGLVSKKQFEELLEQTKEMEQKQDSKRLLFVYKVSLIIGLDKTGELLKEVEKEIEML